MLYEYKFFWYNIWGGIFLSRLITSRNRGGGTKRLYRRIDFRRNKLGITAKIFSIEYDPNRTSRIALLNYFDGDKRYILYPRNAKVGDVVISDYTVPIKNGNALPLIKIPLGTNVHNIEFRVRLR